VNDVVDALIGDISSKLGTEPAIIKRGDDSWLVDGQCPFYEFVQYFHIPDTDQVEGFTTIGGLILHVLQRFPATGEKIRWKAFEFEIVDMDDQRIDKVLVTMI
jgi:putative hemolysin